MRSPVLQSFVPMLLRARTVIPITQPPIEDGAVVVTGNRVTRVGRWSDLRSEADDSVIDLGEVALLPGLINAHCHLDYTDMAGQIPPAKTFTDWITGIITIKGGWGYSEYAASWLNGARQLLRTGTTTVADIEAAPELLPEIWSATPLRVHSFLELIGIRSRLSATEQVDRAVTAATSLGTSRCRVGLSPHAPYTTSREMLTAAAQRARAERLLVTTHVAESETEYEMFMYRRGEMFNWLKGQRDMGDCGHGSPVAHLEKSGLLGENFLAVHVNYLWDHDAELLGRHGAHVVHCPRSHDYFQHRCFPRRPLQDAGVNICLGTDSLASMEVKRRKLPVLDMFAEMHALLASAVDVSPEETLGMATVNGARALGRAGELGEISRGALADLIAVPFTGKVEDSIEAVVAHSGDVTASMIDGQWAMLPVTLS